MSNFKKAYFVIIIIILNVKNIVSGPFDVCLFFLRQYIHGNHLKYCKEKSNQKF